MIYETKKENNMKTDERTDRREDRKPKRVRECPWCGCGRSSSQAFDGYCDEHCRESYKRYLDRYQSNPIGRGRR